MLKEIFKSFFYLLLLNNFMFKYFLGVELPLVMGNSPKRIFKFSLFTTIVFILTAPFSFYMKEMVLKPYNVENLSLLSNVVIIIILVYVLSLFFKSLMELKKYIVLNVVFLSTLLYVDDTSILESIIFALMNGIFLFFSFILLSDLHERIETKAEHLKPEFIYYISISIIAMLMFGFTGFKI